MWLSNYETCVQWNTLLVASAGKFEHRERQQVNRESALQWSICRTAFIDHPYEIKPFLLSVLCNKCYLSRSISLVVVKHKLMVIGVLETSSCVTMVLCRHSQNIVLFGVCTQVNVSPCPWDLTLRFPGEWLRSTEPSQGKSSFVRAIKVLKRRLADTRILSIHNRLTEIPYWFIHFSVVWLT